MEMLSDDDLNLRPMTEEELDLAWDLWFDLAQATNDFDPSYTHGAFVLCQLPAAGPAARDEEEGSASQPVLGLALGLGRDRAAGPDG